MKTLLISYDLGSPETYEDYKILINHIKTFSSWAKPLKSVWIVKTDRSVGEVRDELRRKVDSNDKVFVIDVTRTAWASYNVSTEVTGWMKNNL